MRLGSMVALHPLVPKFCRRHMHDLPATAAGAQTPLSLFLIVEKALIKHANMLNHGATHQNATTGNKVNGVWLTQLAMVRFILRDVPRIPVAAQLAPSGLNNSRFAMVVDQWPYDANAGVTFPHAHQICQAHWIENGILI